MDGGAGAIGSFDRRTKPLFSPPPKGYTRYILRSSTLRKNPCRSLPRDPEMWGLVPTTYYYCFIRPLRRIGVKLLLSYPYVNFSVDGISLARIPVQYKDTFIHIYIYIYFVIFRGRGKRESVKQQHYVLSNGDSTLDMEMRVYIEIRVWNVQPTKYEMQSIL